MFNILIYLFLERGEGKKKERERKINVWLPLVHLLLGTWPTAQACVLTGNQSSDPLVLRSALSPLSHTSQGNIMDFDSAKVLLLGHNETYKIRFLTEIERRELKNQEDLAEV